MYITRYLSHVSENLKSDRSSFRSFLSVLTEFLPGITRKAVTSHISFSGFYVFSLRFIFSLRFEYINFF